MLADVPTAGSVSVSASSRDNRECLVEPRLLLRSFDSLSFYSPWTTHTHVFERPPFASLVF